MKRLMNTFEQVFTGKRNWWRQIFLPKGAKWVSSGLTMSEMQHLEGLRENRLSILAALGIPPSKVGLVQDVNRSTSDNQDKDFWEESPWGWRRFEGMLDWMDLEDTSYLLPDFQEYITKLDSVRGTDARIIFPELSHLFVVPPVN
jgi:hypothetical protein